MDSTKAAIVASVVAVYPNHVKAEQAVRQLHAEGFPLEDLSIVGRDFQMTEEPYGFVTPGDYARAGAKTGAWFGGLFGLLTGVGLLILPGLGLIVVGGPIAAALLAAIEAGLVGTAVGGLAGALIGWGIPRERALKYETQIKGGKFLVVVRSAPLAVARAQSLLSSHTAEHIDVFGPTSS